MASGRPSVRLLLVLAAVLLAAGCASTDPLADEEVPDALIRYESERIELETEGVVPRLTVRVSIGCANLPCDPGTGRLVFVSHQGRTLYRDDHTLTIRAGNLEISYPGPSYDAPVYEDRTRTERITVPVAFDDLGEIAGADSLRGRLGPTSWSLPRDRRRSMRSIVRQIEP